MRVGGTNQTARRRKSKFSLQKTEKREPEPKHEGLRKTNEEQPGSRSFDSEVGERKPTHSLRGANVIG